MNVITAILIFLLFSAFLAFVERIYSINKGKTVPKSLTSELINVFAIIPRGLVRELRGVLNSDLKTEDRLKALINVIIVALFLISAIIGSVVMLVYTPFGGKICAYCSIGIFVSGFFCALVATNISIHKAF